MEDQWVVHHSGAVFANEERRDGRLRARTGRTFSFPEEPGRFLDSRRTR